MSAARFEPRPEMVAANLETILALTPEAYAARFRRSAIKRAKLAGLKRNARTLLDHTPKKDNADEAD